MAALRRSGLLVVACVAMVSVGLLLGFGATTGAAVVLASLLVMLLLRSGAGSQLYVLGAILPIYAVDPISPGAFRDARFGLLGCIAAADLMNRRLGLYRMPNRKWWLYAGVLSAAAGVHLSAGAAALVVGFVGAALVGSRIGSNDALARRLMTGYRAGVVFSSLSVLATTLGLNGLSPTAQLNAYAGLSYRSTGFSYTAALAIVFWYSAGSAHRSRGLRFAGWLMEGLVVGSALLASGGRGGLVAAIAAIVLLPLVAGHLALTLKVVVVSCLALAGASLLGFSVLTLNRLLPHVRDPQLAIVDQYGSGRGDLLRSNLAVARRNLLVGAGFDAAGLNGFGAGGQATNTIGPQGVGDQTSPHILLLAMLVAGGIVLAVATVVVLTDAGIRAYAATVHRVSTRSWAAAGVVVFLVNGILETGGGLVGFESILLFACMVRALSAPAGSASAGSTPVGAAQALA